jgi:hypothetical protein
MTKGSPHQDDMKILRFMPKKEFSQPNENPSRWNAKDQSPGNCTNALRYRGDHEMN